MEDIPVPEESQTGASGSIETSLSNTMVSSSLPPKSSGEGETLLFYLTAIMC